MTHLRPPKNLENGCRSCPQACRFTYDLVDAGDLGLENRDGVSDRRLLGALVVGDGRGAESASLHRAERLVRAHSADNLRKHPLIIINLYTSFASFKFLFSPPANPTLPSKCASSLILPITHTHIPHHIKNKH